MEVELCELILSEVKKRQSLTEPWMGDPRTSVLELANLGEQILYLHNKRINWFAKNMFAKM